MESIGRTGTFFELQFPNVVRFDFAGYPPSFELALSDMADLVALLATEPFGIPEGSREKCDFKEQNIPAFAPALFTKA